MKNKLYSISLFVVMILLSFKESFAQINCTDPNNRCAENGFVTPAKGTVRVLLIFAEIVGTGCTGLTTPDPLWPTGQLPPDKDIWLNYAVSSTPTGNTKYYKEISLGELNVIGDYYNDIIQVPCGSSDGAVINQLNAVWQPDINGNYLTAHGLNLNDFDSFTTTDYYSGLNGKYKTNTPDGNMDAVVIIWRNKYDCGSGLGVANALSNNIKGKVVRNYGAWRGCPGDLKKDFFKIEFFHSLYGGNNFHTGAGAGTSNFSTDGFVNPYSTTGQSGASSSTLCGWDRWWLNYKGSRTYSISALNTSGTEVVSDINIVTHPTEQTFILRDFVTVGDAVRIKLPHLNWAANGDKKNQYLWLENHQKISEFDANKNECSPWSKGMYAYIQVGKDILKTTGTNIYDGNPNSHPNQLSDYFFPLTAEGKYDMFYDVPNKQAPTDWEVCIWNNRYVPYGKTYPNGSVLANPLTGDSDQNGAFDSNGDQYINSSDSWSNRMKKYLGTVGSSTSEKLVQWGDSHDAFTSTSQKIYLGANPAPLPVYTQSEGASSFSSYENRTIPLNNLSIEIISTDYYNNGTNAYQIKIKWDDDVINDDTRWCGNVQLKNDVNDPMGVLNGGSRTSNITLAPNKKLVIDQGTSSTKLTATTTYNGKYLFADPTTMLLESGTFTTLKPSSQIQVTNGSTLRVKTGSTVKLEASSNINVDATSFLCIETLTDVQFSHPTAMITVNGNTFYGNLNPVNAVSGPFNNATLGNGVVYYNDITLYGTTTNIPSTAAVYKARNFILLNPNTTLVSTGTGTVFEAVIQKTDFVNNCTGAGNFRNATASTSSTKPVYNIDGTEYHSHATFSDNEEIVKVFQSDVYPNPSSGNVTLDLYKFDKGAVLQLSILNSVGESIYKSNYNGSAAYTIDLSNYKEGIYFVLVTTDGTSEMHKLVINK